MCEEELASYPEKVRGLLAYLTNSGNFLSPEDALAYLFATVPRAMMSKCIPAEYSLTKETEKKSAQELTDIINKKWDAAWCIAIKSRLFISREKWHKLRYGGAFVFVL